MFRSYKSKMAGNWNKLAAPSGRAVEGVGLQPLVCCDRWFESHWGMFLVCLSVVSVVCVVCCQVEVYATS
jgi:hypothetical protein